MYNANKKRNRNAQRSVELMVAAYTQLLCENPQKKITITSIVKKAGLNRSTFYAHFDSPEDVHKLLEQNIVDELMANIDEMDINGIIADPSPLLNIVSKRISEHREYAELLFEVNGTAHWLENVKEEVIKRFISVAQSEGVPANDTLIINIRFFVGGYIALCRDCLMKKIDIPIESLTAPLAKTMSAGLKAAHESK